MLLDMIIFDVTQFLNITNLGMYLCGRFNSEFKYKKLNIFLFLK